VAKHKPRRHKGTRFAKGGLIGDTLKKLYDKEELHEAVKHLDEVLEPVNIPKIEAALRWICYHSQLGPEDSIILGASKPYYLKENIAAFCKGPLPEETVTAIERVWRKLSKK
jgi:aflatoxin B1 aldehyde reductase